VGTLLASEAPHALVPRWTEKNGGKNGGFDGGFYHVEVPQKRCWMVDFMEKHISQSWDEN
jgi:hypothetical protein